MKHDSITSGNTTALKGNHNECGICHGVKANGTLDGFVVQDPALMKGIYTYVPATDHKDGSVTMNDNSNGITTDDANYDPATGGCSNAACHANDASHQIDPVSGTMPTTSLIRARDIGPGTCYNCHGGGLTAYGSQNAWPDSETANGTNWPNRTGAHQNHVNAIYVQNISTRKRVQG